PRPPLITAPPSAVCLPAGHTAHYPDAGCRTAARPRPICKRILHGGLMSSNFIRPTGANADWAARDLRTVWHPCTQMKDHEWLPMVPVARGEGVWLYDFNGNRYLDAVSSWWVNLFGHCNPRIN